MSIVQNLHHHIFTMLKEHNNQEENIKSKNFIKSYIVVDAARVKKLTNELIGLTNIAYKNLFMSYEQEKFEEVAPYLIELKEKHEFTTWVYENVYGELGAIFLQSNQEIEIIAETLRDYITTTTNLKHPKRENEMMEAKAYVRLYDPRVFFYFIDNLENKASFFQNIQRVYLENKHNAKVLECVTLNNKMSIHLEETV